MRHNLILVVAVAACVVYSSTCAQASNIWPFKKSPNVFENTWNVESQLGELAQMVCSQKKDSPVIGRISTITKLADYFEQQSAGTSSFSAQELAACKEKYGASLRALRQVVMTHNDNVCSDEKISAIEEFHRRFISTLGEDLTPVYTYGASESETTGVAPNTLGSSSSSSSTEIPRMLTNFFAHYANQISRMCKQSIVPLLEKDVSQIFKQPSDYSITAGVEFTGRVAQTVGNFFQHVHHYDDILLLWDLVDSTQQHSSSEKSLIVDTVDEVTGEPVKLLMVANNIKPLVLAQHRCRQKFRPVYGKILLPVARLADIGYSYTDSQIKADEELLLRDNKLVELWYRLTQFCEAILPIQFLQDSTLDELGTLIISLPERAQYLEATAKVMEELKPELAAEAEGQEYEPMRGMNELPKEEDILRTIQSPEGAVRVIKVHGSASARSRNVRRLMARLVRGLKKVFTGKLKLSHQAARSLGVSGSDLSSSVEENVPHQAGQVTGDFALIDIKSLLTKPSVAKELQKLEQQPTTSSSSTELQHENVYKRGLGSTLWGIVCAIVWLSFIAVCIGSLVISVIAIVHIAG